MITVMVACLNGTKILLASTCTAASAWCTRGIITIIPIDLDSRLPADASEPSSYGVSSCLVYCHISVSVSQVKFYRQERCALARTLTQKCSGHENNSLICFL